MNGTASGLRRPWSRWGWQRHHWELLALFVASLGFAYMFWMLGSEIHEGELAGVDRAVRDVFVRYRSDAATGFFEAISYLGTRGLLAPVAAFCAWRIAGRNLTAAALMLLCGFVASEFVDVVKVLFGIPRPATGFAVRQSSSFPSGHVSGVASFAVFLTLVAARHRARPALVAAVGAVVVALMAMSRVYLDMHWFSDVVGGMLVGGVIGLGFSALYEWYRLRSAAAREPSRY